MASGFGGWQVPSAHVDLQRGQYEVGHVQGFVPRLAHADEFLFSDTIMDMQVALSLCRHRGLILHFSAVGHVVVTHKDPSVFGKLKNSLH